MTFGPFPPCLTKRKEHLLIFRLHSHDVKIICGREDTAGQNICSSLREQFSLDSVVLEDHPVYHNYPERDVSVKKGELIIVPSRHSSERRVKSLTVHAAGNFDSNNLGGFKYKMSPYNASIARSILRNLKKYGSGLGYEITYEATHHGPFSENPLIFVEIGSTEEEYKDKEAGSIVARSIFEAKNEEAETYCGIGGIHYSMKFTKIALNESIAIGHIASKYRFESLSAGVLKEMMEKTPGSKGFLIEGKSFNSMQKSGIKDMLDDLSFSYRIV